MGNFYTHPGCTGHIFQIWVVVDCVGIQYHILFIALLNAGLGTVAGLVYGGVGVVWAWVVALVLGSLVVIIAFHLENKISFRSLLPTDSFWLMTGSFTSAILGWGIYQYFRANMGGWSLLLLSLLVFVLMTIRPFVFHPMTSACRRWLQVATND